MCPKRDQESKWRAVGCRRGALKYEDPPLSLCPKQNIVSPSNNRFSLELMEARERNNLRTENRYLGQKIARRQQSLMLDAPLSERAPDIDVLLSSLESQWPIIKGLQNHELRRNTARRTELTDLDECILAIVWEILDCPESKSLLAENLEELVVLLRSAVLYQVEPEHQLQNVSFFLWLLSHCLIILI